jgi:DNA-binding HxlR family transcriptional regulator
MGVEKAEAEAGALKGEAKSEKSVEISSGKTAQIIVSQEDSPFASDFHNNDNKVLTILNEAGSNYSFKGLMRKLNLHQQSLSRALHRLEEMGLVEKTQEGYKLRKMNLPNLQRQPKGTDYMQLLQTYIPVNVKASEVARHLVGKWFKNLRWLGMIESATGYTLQWASEDGSFQINLRLISDYIVIETNASTEREKVQSMAGSYAIYQQITKAIENRIGNAYVLRHHGGANN